MSISLNNTSSPSLQKAYERYLLAHGFAADPAQEKLVSLLQDLSDSLVCLEEQSRKPRCLFRFWRKAPDGTPSEKGIYIWGDVGRGKTLLANLFFYELPVKHKKRLHFHEFMRDVHASLAEIRNTPEPLRKIAAHFARDSKLLYLDELHVTNIGDAMILGKLLSALLDFNVTLLITSNCPPHALYKDGLQRQRFLPAIALIENRLQVVELCSARDYRLQFLSQTRLYITPADGLSEKTLEENFANIASGPVRKKPQLAINGRAVAARKLAGGVVWFDFDAICGSRRASSDYLEIAKCYETVFISDVPVFRNRDDQARRFINMVDTFYDRRVRLVVSARDEPGHLYCQGRLAQEFRRTASRLVEMQSSGYIAQTHR